MIVGLLVADEVIYDSENATRIDDLVGGTFPVSRNSGFWSNAAAQRIFAIQYREVGRRFWALSDSIVLLDHGPKDGRNWVP